MQGDSYLTQVVILWFCFNPLRIAVYDCVLFLMNNDELNIFSVFQLALYDFIVHYYKDKTHMLSSQNRSLSFVCWGSMNTATTLLLFSHDFIRLATLKLTRKVINIDQQRLQLPSIAQDSKRQDPHQRPKDRHEGGQICQRRTFLKPKRKLRCHLAYQVIDIRTELDRWVTGLIGRCFFGDRRHII